MCVAEVRRDSYLQIVDYWLLNVNQSVFVSELENRHQIFNLVGRQLEFAGVDIPEEQRWTVL